MMLLVMKILNPHANIMDQHGPMFVIAGVLDCGWNSAARDRAVGRTPSAALLYDLATANTLCD